MRRLFLSLLIATLLVGIPQPVRADAEVMNVEIEYKFGEYITFRARVLTSVPIKQIFLSLRREGELNAFLYPMSASANGYYTYTHDMSKNSLRPFTRLTFAIEGELENGQSFTSSGYLFRYDDNRFIWKSREQAPLKVFWYEGDTAFGQAALDAALDGFVSARQVVPLAQSAEVEIYIYASPEDLQSALALGGVPWQAGHASPDLGVVMVAIPPGMNQSLLMDQLIPHELAHVLMYKGLKENYANLPAWFREGVATLAERFPNPDYEHALRIASQEHSLLPLADLCNIFPPDQSRAFLAYAESASFTRYLRDQYGNVGLSALAMAYSDALNCEQGTLRGLGVPLSSLERDWRENVLGENLAGVAFRNLFPYAFVLALFLVLPFVGILNATWRKSNVHSAQ
ncbi:MAG: peptidase MA family metallohydrolase [Candidatus Villigracilaceae bacterium]